MCKFGTSLGAFKSYKQRTHKRTAAFLGWVSKSYSIVSIYSRVLDKNVLTQSSLTPILAIFLNKHEIFYHNNNIYQQDPFCIDFDIQESSRRVTSEFVCEKFSKLRRTLRIQ